MRAVIFILAKLLITLPLAGLSFSLEEYARHAQFRDVKISPGGQYLAVSNRADDGNVQVIVLDRTSMNIVSQNHFRGSDTIHDFYWANDERLIFTMAREIGGLESSEPTGELFAVNADGRRGFMLTGSRSRNRVETSSTVIDFFA